LAEIYTRHFSVQKCQSKVVKNFSEADKKITKLFPDLVLVDIALEEHRGLQWIKSLKNEELTRNIPVAVLTGIGDRESIIAALQSGAEKYFLKSQITPRELAVQLNEFLKKKTIPTCPP